MERNKHTTDVAGFDYMANTGQEEQDRDTLGIVFATLIIVVLAAFQYWGLY
jgi:hypothetical protein